MGKIYFISDCENIKIGFTKSNVEKRLKQLQTGCVKKLYILGYITGNIDDEKKLHTMFGASRIRCNGEWFRPTKDLLDYINQHNEKINTYVDYINGQVLPLLALSVL